MAPGYVLPAWFNQILCTREGGMGAATWMLANVIYQTSQSEQRIHVAVSYDNIFMLYRAMSQI